MAKYIDVDKLKDAWIDKIYIPPRCGKSITSQIALLMSFIDDIPAADVVEVVRCKDCKWYNIFRLECYKPHRNGVSWIDGFCSYGERSKDNAK